jgi:hypothetical protein
MLTLATLTIFQRHFLGLTWPLRGLTQKSQGTNMGAGSPWPTCGTYTDDWLVTFSFPLKVF